MRSAYLRQCHGITLFSTTAHRTLASLVGIVALLAHLLPLVSGEGSLRGVGVLVIASVAHQVHDDRDDGADGQNESEAFRGVQQKLVDVRVANPQIRPHRNRSL